MPDDFPPLHEAVNTGDVFKVRDLLESGRYDVNTTDSKGMCTPLFLASFLGKLDMARMLVSEFKADVNFINSAGQTPLLIACFSGHIDMVQMLVLEFMADVNCLDANGYTPLYYASINGDIDTVRFLVEQKTDMTIQEWIYGSTPLMMAALLGQNNVVQALLDELKCTISPKNRFCWTALHCVCASGHFTSSDLQSPNFKFVPSNEADLGIVKRLILEHNADINAQDIHNNTALHIAAYTGKEDIVVALLSEFGCDINTKGEMGRYLLHSACAGGNASLVQTLILKYSADVKARDDNNDTPLHVAALAGKEEIVQTLLSEFGCDVNIKGQMGKSLLHRACEGGDISLIQTLIQKYNADIYARDDQSNMPLHVAALAGKEEVVCVLLKDFGCDATTRGWLGRSLLHSVCAGINDYKTDDSTQVGMVQQMMGSVSNNIMLFRGGIEKNCYRFQGINKLIQTLILTYKVDANAKDYQNNTPLHIAALTGKEDPVFLLLMSLAVMSTQMVGEVDLCYILHVQEVMSI